MRVVVTLFLSAASCLADDWGLPPRQVPMTVTENEVTVRRAAETACAEAISPARLLSGVSEGLAAVGVAKGTEGMASFVGPVAWATWVKGETLLAHVDSVGRVMALGVEVWRPDAVLEAKAEAGLADFDAAIGLVAADWPVGQQAPVIQPPSVSRPLAVDPLLSIVVIDLWADGPVGELGQQARAAFERGDQAEFRRLAAQYWGALSGAMDRRHVYEARKQADKPGLRATRGAAAGSGRAP